MCHVWCVVSCVMCHVWYHVSRVMCHVSCVSCVMCHVRVSVVCGIALNFVAFFTQSPSEK